MVKIDTVKFNNEVSRNLRKNKHGSNWPVVYIIKNAKEAYIGETTHASVRARQHLKNETRQKLKRMYIISDETFNKSAILDLEAFLIKHMSADEKFKLQNGNTGLQNHDYYQREMYRAKFEQIWDQLKSMGLAQNNVKVIENSNLFKYSPYKSLSVDQYMTANDILNALVKGISNDEKSTFLVHGGAGTGKTILGVYLLKLLSQIRDIDQIEIEEDEVDQCLSTIMKISDLVDDFNVGLVIPMANLRATLKRVFNGIKGLSSKMVLSPNDVCKSDMIYDVLIVDEAHRLRRRKNFTQYKIFDQNNKEMGLGKNGTELDWILLKSKYQIFFYDERQTIKPTDVRKEEFDKLESNENCDSFYLETQLRCMLGGEEYINYVNEIFSHHPPKKKLKFKKYDFKIFENVNDLVENIKAKDKEFGLCRNVAGYAWPWKSKGNKLPMHLVKKDVDSIINSNVCDIEIDGYKYIWNTKATDWINSPNSVNEIGSIHTIQGFDLNYTGLIIGNDLKYDDVNKKIVVDRKHYFDIKGKAGTTEDELLNYLLNIYSTMCTRGMLGTYIYVCDEKLREYLKKYIDVI